MKSNKKNKNDRREKSEEKSKAKFMEKVTEALELPKEIVLNVPKITMVGNSNMIIENYKGVIEYESSRIRINTNKGIIKITGKGLLIKEITSEDIMIDGNINILEFME